jgi:hypothetical protein
MWLGNKTKPSQILFSLAGASEYIAKGSYRQGITGAVVMHHHSPAIRMAIHPAGSPEPPIDEAISF